MKKLLLIAFLFISIESIAQTRFTAFAVQMAELNIYTNEWVWNPYHNVDMLITITDHKVYIDDIAHSIYTIVGSNIENSTYKRKVNKFRAFDEKGRNCSLEMVYWTNKESSPQLYVVYSDIRYAYSLTSK